MLCILLLYSELWLSVNGGLTHFNQEECLEDRKMKFIADLINFNYVNNGWRHMICVGRMPDNFYRQTKHLPLTLSISDPGSEMLETRNTIFFIINSFINHASNFIVIYCEDFNVLDHALANALDSPYWNPRAQLLLYYHTATKHDVSRTFFILWFYMITNGVIIQFDDSKEMALSSYYSPYVSENFKFENMYGCWKTTKVGRPVLGYNESFACEIGCHNVTLDSKLRALHLGTCIGFNTHAVLIGDNKTLSGLKIFEDKTKNLHGFTMRAYTVEIAPFMKIIEHNDGSFELLSRDGLIWRTLSERMNFSIDLTPSKDVMKKSFNFEVNINMIFYFALRQVDLLLMPVYQFDLVIVEVDMSVEYKDSGVCIMSRRADFETILFDVKLLEDNITLVIQFILCFLCMWLLFFTFNVFDKGQISFDQFGKDMVNTIRSVLSITLHKPPTRRSFRIFLTFSIWCFFILNFGIQAAIVSFFSAYKRGKDVDTFEDVIEKGYVLEGMASPDMMLPATEVRFQILNSRMQSNLDLYACVNKLANDSKRFCLIDCAVGRYIERNRLNEKGEQYLHIARKDRMHGNYLIVLSHKNSPLTPRINKYLRRFTEMGLIKKWEQYRFAVMKEEYPVKALNMEDLMGVFKCYWLLLGLSSGVFILEVLICTYIRLRCRVMTKLQHWKCTRITKRKQKSEKVKIYRNSSTQTV